MNPAGAAPVPSTTAGLPGRPEAEDDMRADYSVGVDPGTTWTAAAISRPGGPAEVVALGERSPALPSTVLVDDDGVFTIGEAAERRALSDPSRVVREFKRRIGDRTPILVGGVPTAPETLTARFVTRVLHDVTRRYGGPATRVAVTHPAGWGPHKLDALRGALAAEGLGGAVLLPEPQAAAIGYADSARVEAGSTVAVFDLGGGTFDAAVVRTLDGPRGFALLGRPDGIEQLGGVDFDEVVFAHVRTELGAAWLDLDPSDPGVLAAVAGLRLECTAAKEALSHDTEVTVPVVLPGVQALVRLERAAFEELIRPAVADAIASLGRAVASAGVTPDTVLLVGGSSRIPLVGAMVAAELGRPVAIDADPKGVIARGAALVAGRRQAPGVGSPSRVPAGPDRAAARVGTAIPGGRPDPTADTGGALPETSAPGVGRHDAEGPYAARGPGLSGWAVATGTPDGSGPQEGAARSFPVAGVRPFRGPDTGTRRVTGGAIGTALAVVGAVAVLGVLLAGVYRPGPVTTVGPAAEASTPAAATPSATPPIVETTTTPVLRPRTEDAPPATRRPASRPPAPATTTRPPAPTTTAPPTGAGRTTTPGQPTIEPPPTTGEPGTAETEPVIDAAPEADAAATP